MKAFRRYKEKANDTHRTPFIQPKLNIGKPGDKYELEADAMANKVVNGKHDAIQKTESAEEELQQKPLVASISPLVQKQSEASEEETLQTKCTDCEQEEQVQRTEEEEESLQMKAEGSKSTSATIESSLKSSKGGGQKLSKSVRQDMESGFGADFSNVNIHTDSNAVQMSKQLQAQAFTHGNDIYFNEGKYNPSSSEGKHLLAHELTHTIQQKGMVHKKVQMRSKATSKGATSNLDTNNAHQTAFTDGVKLSDARKSLPIGVKNKIQEIEEGYTSQSSGGKTPEIQMNPIVIGAAAIAAAAACAYAFYNHAMENYGSKGDKWLHCYTSCKIATYCTLPVGVLIGYAKEIGDYICDVLGGPCGAEWQDIIANSEGILCSFKFWQSCYDCCEEKFS